MSLAPVPASEDWSETLDGRFSYTAPAASVKCRVEILQIPGCLTLMFNNARFLPPTLGPLPALQAVLWSQSCRWVGKRERTKLVIMDS